LKVGAVYVFNLIVGAGALSLPHAFSESGFALGLLKFAYLLLGFRLSPCCAEQSVFVLVCTTVTLPPSEPCSNHISVFDNL
jgi:hypothetical protein